MTNVNRNQINTETFSSDIVNVCDFGADGTGNLDSTAAITAAHETGKCVYYPNGRYRFNGENLNFEGGVRFASREGVLVHNDIDDRPVLIFDDFGNFVGLRHNHLEYTGEDGQRRIAVGNLIPPPLSGAEYETAVDVMAHFYNDFGKESSRFQCGWKGWYTWSWNYHDAGKDVSDEKMRYHAERDPLLGYYRGDDPVVLDWICYWLAEYGVKGVFLTAGGLNKWEDERCPDHWCYQLFHHVKNFKKLKYGIMMPGTMLLPGQDRADEVPLTETRRSIRLWWNEILQKTYFSSDHPNCYLLAYRGKRYPVMFLFEEDYLRYMLDRDGGTAGTESFFTELAEQFRAHGFDGFAILIRQRKGGYDAAFEERMAARGAVVLTGYYEQGFMPVQTDLKGKTYDELIDAMRYPGTFDGRIAHVFTGAHTFGPHPSCWVHPGNTPEGFANMLRKTVKYVGKAGAPKLVTAYNVSEWSEGGPGIQPNVKDGFGYLDAIYNTVVIGRTEPPSDQT